jgi:PTH1 family peptidyl-tRNA hydrolase
VSSPFLVVAGLGNPGARYDLTRHNVGFAVVDALRACSGVANSDELSKEVGRIAALAVEGRLASQGWIERTGYHESAFVIGDWSVKLVKPMTFMNRSGEPLQAVLAYSKIDISKVIVVHDEIDIPFGQVRIKVDGGEGGHNGLRSISNHCGGRGYARVRVGVGKPPADSPLLANPDGVATWVLSKFNLDERQTAEALVAKSVIAVAELGLNGVRTAQNRFN